MSGKPTINLDKLYLKSDLLNAFSKIKDVNETLMTDNMALLIKNEPNGDKLIVGKVKLYKVNDETNDYYVVDDYMAILSLGRKTKNKDEEDDHLIEYN